MGVMDITTPTYPDVLRRAPELATAHLSVVDPLTLADVALAGLPEPTFSGYLPKPADRWAPVTIGSSPLFVSREMLVAWTADQDGADELVRGWYLTADLAPGSPALVAYGIVKPAVNMNAAGKSCAVLAHVTTIPEEGDSGLRLLVSSVALAFFGGINEMAVRGEDRRALQELKKALERIARRDAAIPSLSARGKRSRVPVVPSDDTNLVSAAEALASRCNTLLGIT